jgi:isochorismate synthase
MNTHSVEFYRTKIADRFYDAWRAARRQGQCAWVTVSLDLPRIDILSLADEFEDIWVFSDQGTQSVGVGVARRWTYHGPQAWADWKADWDRLISEKTLPSDLQVGGGVAFSLDDMGQTKPWGTFPRMAWTLPAILLQSSPEGIRVRLVAEIDGNLPLHPVLDYYHELLDKISTPHPVSNAVPRLINHSSTPSRDQWNQLIIDAVNTINNQQLSKVVVARAVTAIFSDNVKTSPILHQLSRRNPSSKIFALRLQSRTFLGATPEILLETQEPFVSTMALAGSAPRGKTVTEDTLNSQALLRHVKNREEHEAVKGHILNVLKKLGCTVEYPSEPIIKQLPTVQHLFTPITATLPPGSSFWSVAQALQPTPAVGGLPPTAAIEWITQHEPFDRGWYAGVIGHVSLKGQGQLLVALRSALIEGQQATLFGGCGIMAQSNPDDEWEESQWKLRSMLEAMDVWEQL